MGENLMLVKIAVFVFFVLAVNFCVGVVYLVGPEAEIHITINELNNTESGEIALRGLEKMMNTPVALIVVLIGFLFIFRDECKRMI